MAQKIRCKVFADCNSKYIEGYVNAFLDNPNREFISAAQSESHGGYFGDLNITITVWYKEA